MPNFCSKCGAKLDPSAIFCSNCGSRVSSAEAPAPVSAPKPVSVSTEGIGELQNELYSLYKILEPVRELDLAGLAVDAKIAELNEPLPDANIDFYDDFAHYAPFISVDIDEDLITPETKLNKKEWAHFIKTQKEKLYGKKYDPTGKFKYRIDGYSLNGVYSGIYNIFKANEDKVLSDLGASFLYYKMDYCYNPDNKPLFYKPSFKGMSGSWISDFSVMSMRKFVFEYLKKKLGNNYDNYLYSLFNNLNGGNRGELQLHDVPSGYDLVNQSDYKDLVRDKYYDYFYLREGFPKVERYGSYVYNIREIEKAAKSNTKKSMRIKQELDGSIAELNKLRANINNAIDEYMKGVNEYIEKHVSITPYNYAKQWRSVTYFLYLIMNKRGRDIYEVINQYEIDMKHQELTSALGNIQSEIRNQTNVLGSKLDTINRSIIKMTDAITSAIYAQTKTLGEKLDGINYSVVSTGASIVGAVKQLGASMSEAMSNMQFSVSVS